MAQWHCITIVTVTALLSQLSLAPSPNMHALTTVQTAKQNSESRQAAAELSLFGHIYVSEDEGPTIP